MTSPDQPDPAGQEEPPTVYARAGVAAATSGDQDSDDQEDEG